MAWPKYERDNELILGLSMLLGLITIAALTCLASCGVAGDATVHQPPYYTMTWNCETNAKCVTDMTKTNGTGSFTNETDCENWEFAFINLYKGATVTACTYNAGY